MVRFSAVRTPRWFPALLVGTLLAALLPGVTSAVTATTTALMADATTTFPGHVVGLIAQVRPSPFGGTVTFTEGTAVLGEIEVDEDGDAVLSTPFPLGSHTITARFNGFEDFTPSVSAAVTVNVVFEHTTGTPTSVSLVAGPLVPALEAQTITATVTPIPNEGRIILMEGNLIHRTDPIDAADGQISVEIRLEAGVHTLTAIYEGSDMFAASVSAPLTITIPADTVVSATGVGISHATVYPVVDGFGDTTLIRGTALERLSVIIQIFGVTDGRRVRSVGLGTREGLYSFLWNGRTLAGGLVPAGRYNVVQTLTDRHGNRQVFTNGVTVSHRQRVAKTGVLTRTGAAFDREGAVGFGLVVPRETDDSVHVWGNVPGDSAFVAYDFTLPSALQYRTVRAEVSGESQSGKSGATISLLNRLGGEDPSAIAGPANGRYTVTGPVGEVIGARRVSLTVRADGSENQAFRVVSVRLVFTYYALE